MTKRALSWLCLMSSLLPASAMAADSTVAAMTAGSALTGTDLFYCSQAAGTNDRKCTATQIAAFNWLNPPAWFTLDATNQALTLTSIANPAASTLTLAGGTALTTNQPALSISQTWNNGAITFAGFKINITPTAENSASRAIVLQNSGVDVAYWRYDGHLAAAGIGARDFFDLSALSEGTHWGTIANNMLDGLTGLASSKWFLSISSVPTINTCGTSPSVATGSTDSAGSFTTGTAAPTACSIVFADAYPSQAFCTITPANAAGGGATLFPYISSTIGLKTGFTVTFAAGATSAAYNYVCMGQ